MRYVMAIGLMLFGMLWTCARQYAAWGQENLAGRGGGPGHLAFDEVLRRGIFVLESGDRVPLGPGLRVEGRPREAGGRGTAWPMRLRLGSMGGVSGRVERIDATHVRFEAAGLGEALTLPRAMVTGIEQRAGETVELDERFEQLDRTYWNVEGGASVEARGEDAGLHGLRLPGAGATAELRLPVALSAGRLEAGFRLEGGKLPGATFAIELRFGGAEPRVVVITPGWTEERIGIRSLRGPSLTVQRLECKPGWHRLSVRFDSRHLQIGLDGADLAYGAGNGQGLAAVRFATSPGAAGEAGVTDQAAWVDDLRIFRAVERRIREDSDPKQDDVRLAVGDQLFGTLLEADGKTARVEVGGRVVELSWSEVSGMRFQRGSVTPVRQEGDWVEVKYVPEGLGMTSLEPDMLQGVLRGVSEREIVVEVARVGQVRIARDRLAALSVEHRGWRLVIDANSYHLGDREVQELEPPLPEPEPFQLEFELNEVPSGGHVLALDVLGVEGVAGSPAFSEAVRGGDLRTIVELNGQALGDLNSEVEVVNDQALRIRLGMPSGSLKAGKNVIRFIQKGAKDEPRKRDNLAILQVAIESGEAEKQP